jgi:pheromone shutdown protein TraB
LAVQGGEAFAESIDSYRMNWFIKYFQKLMPEQKKLFIDIRDADLFTQIYHQKGSKIVAVVN